MHHTRLCTTFVSRAQCLPQLPLLLSARCREKERQGERGGGGTCQRVSAHDHEGEGVRDAQTPLTVFRHV